MSMLWLCFSLVFAPNIMGQITGCSGTFFDTGGVGGNYSVFDNYTVTYCPDNPSTEAIEISFTSFSVEGGFGFCFDELEIYNGNSTSSPSLGTFCDDTGSPGTVTSTDASGCLTFRFIEDGSTTQAGWSATIDCVPNGGGGGATCSDGIQNGDETGVDCGGSSCPPCSGCSAEAGTLNITGSVTNTGNTYTVDLGGSVTFNNGGGEILPPAAPGSSATVGYAIFNCNPTTTAGCDINNPAMYTSPTASASTCPCYLGVDPSFGDTDNNVGGNSDLLGTNEYWVVKVTLDYFTGCPAGTCDDQVDANGDLCFDPSEVYHIIMGNGTTPSTDSPCECGEPVNCGGAYFTSESAALADYNDISSYIAAHDFSPDISPIAIGDVFEFCYEYTTDASQTSIGFAQALGYYPAATCDFTRVYHVYTSDCSSELTATGSTFGSGGVYTVTGSTTYNFCVDITVTQDCDYFDYAFVWLWGDAPAPSTTCDCTTPDCPAIQYNNIDEIAANGAPPNGLTNPDCNQYSPAISNTTETTCHTVNVPNDFIGVLLSSNNTPAGCVNITDISLYAESGGVCSGSPITPTTANAGNLGASNNPEWDNLASGTYIVCISRELTGACEMSASCLEYYDETTTPPSGTCGDCTDPTCAIGAVPTYDDRSYSACFDPSPDLGPGTFTNCYTATTDATGTLGFVQGHTVNGLCDDAALFASYDYQLYDNTDCGGTVIAPDNANANSQSNGFNPEYSGLTANYDYIICITLTVPADPLGDPLFDCIYDRGCLDYYYIPSTCSITPQNATALNPCQNDAVTLNATEFYTGTPSGTLTYAWSSAPNNIITGSTTGSSVSINTSAIGTNTITLTLTEGTDACGSGTVSISVADCATPCPSSVEFISN